MPDPEKPVEEPKKPPAFVEEEPVVTKHSATIGGEEVRYEVTAGRIPLKNELEEIEAQVFFMAYRRTDVDGPRPLLFTFNGGPGSPSVWLHLGMLGPKRIPMEPGVQLPPPPYRLVENENSWLDVADIVFIDPVGTGYSRSHTKEIGEKYWGLQGDIESVAEFIRLYLTRYDRWGSPLYLVGESYGTMRSAGIAGHLVDRGIAFNGLVLVSSILNWQTARFFKGNDLPYVLFLPTYAATAYFHGRVKRAIGRAGLQTFLSEVERFAAGEYWSALAKGDRLAPRERQAVIAKLQRFTGLSTEYLELRNLRINIHGFCKELLRDKRRTVGRIDSRFTGIDDNAVAENPEHDPSITALMPPYNSAFMQYVRQELGYKTDIEYQIFGGIKSPWSWGNAAEGMPDTSEALRKAMSKNPHMKIFIASGYYDLATPYFATEYTLGHMGLDAAVRSNVETQYYDAGHMMYIHEPALARLKSDITAFLARSAGISVQEPKKRRRKP